MTIRLHLEMESYCIICTPSITYSRVFVENIFSKLNCNFGTVENAKNNLQNSHVHAIHFCTQTLQNTIVQAFKLTTLTDDLLHLLDDCTFTRFSST